MISVQCLRGIAAIMVVIFHAFMKSFLLGVTSVDHFEFGAAGVDLFFIISGYIMVYITYKKDVSVIGFIKNRVTRIIPLYWILTLVAAVAYVALPGMVNSNGPKTTIFNSFTLFPIENTQMLLSVGWTLRYEFIFYFIFSLSLIAGRFRYIAAATVVTAMGAASLTNTSGGYYYDFITNPIIVEFALGIGSFFILKNFGRHLSWSLVIGVLLLSILNINGYVDGMRLINYGIPMFLIFIGFVSMEERINKHVITRVFKYLGDASYSIYLSHLFSIAIVAKAFSFDILSKNIPMALFAPSAVVFSLLSGVICYEVLEKPVTKAIKKATTSAKRQVSQGAC